MQEIFQGHGDKSIKFYQEMTQNQAQIAWEVKRKLSKKCAFTLNKLKVPVRSSKCKTLKCVYELEVIQQLLNNQEQQNKNDPFQCIQCGVQLNRSDLFFDSELNKALKLPGVCFLKNINQAQPSQNQTYLIVNKQDQQAKQSVDVLDEKQYYLIENQENLQLLQILALNIYKQRMETLQCLSKQDRELNLQKFAQDELSKEKSKNY
ncbi:unnamed protein product [Paramecium sonneborni]|uniref:Uncharacterized protein n=1 Tax=Paramecium sonneborni TaxID=65129 RepID=A0A8S1P524_9CILI|nr:unnamed protein product [Paramecium sonneborni]